MFAQATLIFYGSLKASRKFHKSLVHNLMSLPMLFYDTNPQGRIMNRVSKDIDVLDTRLGELLRSWFGCLLKVLSVPVVIGYSTPWFLVMVLPMVILFLAIQVCSVNVCLNVLIPVCLMLKFYTELMLCKQAIF